MVASNPSTMPPLDSVEELKLLDYQIYFWGDFVIHPADNLILACGSTLFRQEDAPPLAAATQVPSACL